LQHQQWQLGQQQQQQRAARATGTAAGVLEQRHLQWMHQQQL
jgi:hypothetical protein